MSALPRKHPTGRQKLKKSNRVYPRYDRDEEKLRKRKIGQKGQQTQGQSLQAKPQTGWTANPAQSSQQNQRPPISKWWWIVIIAIIIIFISIISSTLKNLNNLQGTDNGNGNSENDCTCYCDDGSICTRNSDCTADTSVPGTYVPGVCGCPVGC